LLLYSSHLPLGVSNGLVIYQASHASKEEVAPAGVTVIRIGNAEQGFHSGRKPHPDEKETSSNHRRRQWQLVDEEEHVNHRRRSTIARQEGQ
jgi:hypothetical protein